jgi:hypothetical protein
MLNVKLLLGSSILICCAFALPTNSSGNGNDTRPNFLGAFPGAVEVIEEGESRAGPFDPVNCANRVYETARVGDGKPLDWTRWKQIGVSATSRLPLGCEDLLNLFMQVPISCNGGVCSATVSSTISYTIGFQVSVPINSWISAGFSVSESYSTGTGNGCEADSAKGQRKVCIWEYRGHKTYSVKNLNYPMDPRCGGKVESGELRLTSPLSNNQVRGYWCGFNDDCHDQGHEEWTAGHYKG